MPKLLNPKTVTDSQGRTWEYQPSEVLTEEFLHRDYQGPPIKMTRSYIALPDGTRAVLDEKPTRGSY